MKWTRGDKWNIGAETKRHILNIQQDSDSYAQTLHIWERHEDDDDYMYDYDNVVFTKMYSGLVAAKASAVRWIREQEGEA